ncbi:leucine-rich repeat domain-containing protein [Capnocytophaga ochracea]|uniref:leucine-rich repeat domain-containing protein n=1 Tax=Capnocytophaga ochracea TaxID=1018 RepID=UPI00222F445F|nr:leucine-rich repeat domain-containing protein [Capnocytophaga ochracea]UZD36701.1 leucine-rich repeat domain-containing protein [Capnocytophaga ochracea]
MRKLGNLKMRKVLLLALIGIALVGCRKSDDDNNGNSTADYELSADGRTLIKWKNANTTVLDMQADEKLRNVNTIGKEAFKEHQNLQSITFPNNLKEIEESAFEEASLSGTVTFNTNATVVFGDKAFFKTKIRKLSLPNVKRLPYSVLSMSYNLEELHFNKVEILGFGAIGWNYLKEINLENTGLTDIETVGISGCTEMKSVVLPATLKTIGYDAFWYCQQLTTITINAVNPPALVNNPFRATRIEKIYVPKNSVEQYKRATFWSAFSDKIYPKAQ